MVITDADGKDHTVKNEEYDDEFDDKFLDNNEHYIIIPDWPKPPKDSQLNLIRKQLFNNIRVDEYGISYMYFKPIKNWKLFLERELKQFYERLENRIFPDVTLNDFEFIKAIGIGGFGKVILVEMIQAKVFLAAKIVSIISMKKAKKTINCQREKEISCAIYFPFSVNLEFYFEEKHHIFFIMPFIIGGDLFNYMQEVGYFTEGAAKFYAAQILLTFEYLHNLNILYRDLKPENVLIDHHGYLKLSDFGLCKLTKTRTYTLTGTPEYLAPEMICNKGYGTSVDWWTFGVFIYELCAGFSPFASQNYTYSLLKISKARYLIPSHFSKDLQDLVNNILVIDLTKRFGILKNGVQDIKCHHWFSDIDWLMLLNRQLLAPYRPSINSPYDTQHFGEYDDDIYLDFFPDDNNA